MLPRGNGVALLPCDAMFFTGWANKGGLVALRANGRVLQGATATVSLPGVARLAPTGRPQATPMAGLAVFLA